MIIYQSGALGGLVWRVHGSPVVKALFISLTSTALLLTADLLFEEVNFEENDLNRPIDAPYAIGVLMAAFTFLLVFRANFSYARYWEAAADVHTMLSNWNDIGMSMAAFHYQCSQYDPIRPPSFGKHPNLVNVSRDRHRLVVTSPDELKRQLDEIEPDQGNPLLRGINRAKTVALRRRHPRRLGSVGLYESATDNKAEGALGRDVSSSGVADTSYVEMSSSPVIDVANHKTETPSASPSPTTILPAPRARTQNASVLRSVARLDGGVTSPMPSLFLQEGAHLLSLLSAVSMSTLRNDIEGTDMPLVTHDPGSPFPPVDPDQLSWEVRSKYEEGNRCLTGLYFLLGVTRGKKHRTLYNAARPFQVLGGVSDGEARLLKEASGPSAKVSLVTMWLQEFITREYLAGSTGAVAPPIIGRLYQLVTNGMNGYNQARKIAYTPFPFPHAQITSLFVLVVCIFLLPTLMYSYVNNVVLGCLFNFFTVLCFAGLHEVARELENPFQNVPNDIPLATYQAQFNEGLLSMHAGFHPDAWWELPAVAVVPPLSAPRGTSSSYESGGVLGVHFAGSGSAMAGASSTGEEGDGDNGNVDENVKIV